MITALAITREEMAFEVGRPFGVGSETGWRDLALRDGAALAADRLDEPRTLQDVAHRRTRGPGHVRRVAHEPSPNLLRPEMGEPLASRDNRARLFGRRCVWANGCHVRAIFEPACAAFVATALPNVDRLTAHAIPAREPGYSVNAGVVVLQNRDTLCQNTRLLKGHQSNLLVIRATSPVRHQPGLKCQQSTRFVPHRVDFCWQARRDRVFPSWSVSKACHRRSAKSAS